MSAFLTHLWIRLRATLGSPGKLALMILSGAILLGPFGLGAASPSAATAWRLLWIYVWTGAAAPLAGGRGMSGWSAGAWCPCFHPALPIGVRARALAEATLVVLLLLGVWPAALALKWQLYAHGVSPHPGLYAPALSTQYARQTFERLVVVLPPLVAWLIPARSHNLVAARAGVVVGLELVAAWLGLLATPARAVATCALLVAIPLALAGREWHAPHLAPAGSRPIRVPARPARPPHRQLARDFLVRPLPSVALLIAAQGLVLVVALPVWDKARLFGGHGTGLLHFGTGLVVGSALGLVAVRPMASNQTTGGLFGRAGYRQGDFAAAWSLLPVRPQAVLLGAYLHGLLVSLGILLALVGVQVLSTFVERRQWLLVDTDGGPAGLFLLPLIAVVPCVAGFVAASAVGHRRKAALATLAFLLILIGHSVTVLLEAPVLVGLALVGGVPILLDLRRPAA